MQLYGNLESVMSSCSSIKQGGSNSRGGNTYDNPSFSTKMMGNGPVDKSLPTTSCSLEKEALATAVPYCSKNFLKRRSLLCIELLAELLCIALLILSVIVKLLCKQRVPPDFLPCNDRGGHAAVYTPPPIPC